MLRLSRLLRASSQRPVCLATAHGSRSAIQRPTLSRRGLASATAAAVRTERPRPTPSEDYTPTIATEANRVNIAWSEGITSAFHNIWLRDHCRCSQCFHSITKQRLQNTFEIPKDIAPRRVDTKVEGIQISWNTGDNHVSFYPWAWLRENSYDPPLRERVEDKVPWASADVKQSPPTVAYEEVMRGDRGLFDWLSNVDRFGFSFVSGVPVNPEATEELCERIGFIRETQYGKFWDFTSDLAKGDTAYTTLALGAHTDNTYFTDPCGLQLFHLLSHTNGSGGATLLVDGFHAATRLKSLYPSSFKLLSSIPVPAHAAGEPSALYRPTPTLGYPTITVDKWTGQLTQVRWNNDDRSVMNHIPGHLVEEWYEAIGRWNELLNSPESQYWVQLKPGNAVVTDNHRVLHGRSAFDGKRRMCGAYIGVDEYRSKLAVLKEKFSKGGMEKETEALPGSVVNGRSIWSN
ncbi:mitochondrial protein [Coprinopsis sp. MPI-PUGE-AT-0042]|nr:mitochondrial protein [Coprinopsis sp. MPI-PUGE-AT-0042]